MPGPWLYIDARFPTFTGKENSAEQIGELLNYLFLLVEQLKYSLNNLDAGNFNPKALDEMAESSTAEISKTVATLRLQLGQLNQTVTAHGESLAALEESLEAAWEAIRELQEGEKA